MSEPLRPVAELLTLIRKTPVDAARLDALAAEISSLPTRGDSEAERCESAGRLLMAAIEAGAFGAPEYFPFLLLVRQRLEEEKHNGWICAWAEARWWLTGKPKMLVRLDATFEEDCERVAKLILNTAPEELIRDPAAASPAKDDGADGHETNIALDDEETIILNWLAKHPKKLYGLYTLGNKTGISRKTVGKKLNRLIGLGLAVRPNGSNKGATITREGISFLNPAQ